MSYLDDAKESAVDTVNNFEDEILERLVNDDDASDDLLNDYPNGDSYHHENHTDKYYSPTEAIALLEELDEYEETDRGLWEGVEDWRKIIGTIAAYTYSNAVHAQFRALIEEINGGYRDAINDALEEMRDAAKKTLAEFRTEEKDEDEDAVLPEDISDDEADDEIDEDELKNAKLEALKTYLKEVTEGFCQVG